MSEKIIDLVSFSKDSRLETLYRIKKSCLPLFMYGAGRTAGLIIRWLKEYNIIIDGVCVDTQYYRDNCSIEGYPIEDIEIVKSRYSKLGLIIGFEDTTRARQIIKEYTATDIEVYHIEDPFRFKYMSFDFFLRNSDNFQKSYDLLEDELSKKIFISALNSRLSGDSFDIAQWKQDSNYEYDYELLELSENETLVDCGAFDGDTIAEFVEFTQNRFNKIIAFEPDQTNVEKLQNRINDNRVQIIQKGVGKCSGEAEFYSDSSLYSNLVCSDIWGRHTRRDLYGDIDTYNKILITSIDETAYESLGGGDRISVIKMDIEGSELEALMGAQRVISNNLPKLIICVYHKKEDMFTIFDYIENLIPHKYKYYLRHHSDNMSETVLYALPIKSEIS